MEILTKIIDVIDPILKEAQNLAEKLDSDPDSVTESVVSLVSELAAKLNALLLKGVNELSDDATDDANSVIECINGQEENTNAALKETIQLATECIAVKYSDIYAAANEVLTDLLSLEEDIEGQVATLSECTDSDLSCLTALVKTLYVTATKVIDKLPTDVTDIVEVAVVLIDQLKTCDLAPGIKKNAENILDGAAKCIKA